MEFDSREDVLIWIFQNQIGRRNLTDYARTEAALKLKDAIAKKARDNQRAVGGAVPSNLTEAPIDTRKEVADLAGVSAGNVSKVEYIQQHAKHSGLIIR